MTKKTDPKWFERGATGKRLKGFTAKAVEKIKARRAKKAA
jgi:hypothetical protein